MSKTVPDYQKLKDIKIMTKEEFLKSYSYLNEADYWELKKQSRAKRS